MRIRAEAFPLPPYRSLADATDPRSFDLDVDVKGRFFLLLMLLASLFPLLLSHLLSLLLLLLFLMLLFHLLIWLLI